MDAYLRRLAEVPTFGAETGPSHDSDPEKPRKRLKRETPREAEESSSEEGSARKAQDYASAGDEEQTRQSHRITDVETVLPPTQTNDEAIEEYELAKSSQTRSRERSTDEATPGPWTKGKSSIYVDAFNLALDTVLEEESHLFDEREAEVFRQWKSMSYESQFL